MRTPLTISARSRPTVSPELVLDHAMTLFARQGYHGTALSEIAHALGVRTPSLYNHMQSKHDLLVQIVEPATRMGLDELRDAVASTGNAPERLLLATRRYAYRQAMYPREALIVNRDAVSLDEPMRSEVNDRRRTHEHEFRQILLDGVEAGEFDVESPAIASFAILEMCVSIARWFRGDGPRTAEDVADAHAGFALAIARSGRLP